MYREKCSKGGHVVELWLLGTHLQRRLAPSLAAWLLSRTAALAFPSSTRLTYSTMYSALPTVYVGAAVTAMLQLPTGYESVDTTYMCV